MTHPTAMIPKHSLFRSFLLDRRGSSYVEYMAITAVVGVVVLGAYSGSSDVVGDSLVDKSLKMLGVSSGSQSSGDTSAASRESAAQWDETMRKRREAGEKQKAREEERRQLGEQQRARNAERAAAPGSDSSQ